MKETHFLLDDELAKNEEELNKILFELEHPKLEKNKCILKSFTKALILATSKPKPKHIPIIRRPVIKRSLLKPPEIQAPVPSQPQRPKPQPEVKKPEPPKITKIVKRLQPITTMKKVELIHDKITNELLVSADITDIYKLNEPQLDKEDIQVYNKVMSKDPKNMEKAWKLIQKYGKKFKIKPKHDTRIKYYLVDDLLGFGKVEPLLNDPKITKITCEGLGNFIEVEREGKTLKTNLLFEKPEELKDFFEVISHRTKQKLDKKHPILDAEARKLKIHVTLAPNIAESKFNFKRI